MSGIVEGVGNLFQGVLNIIWGIISTITQTFQGLIDFVLSAFKGVFDLGEGLVGFVIGNIFIIGAIAAIYFAYTFFARGSPSAKKRN